MKDKIILRVPTLDDREKAEEYKKEHFDAGEKVIYGSDLWDQMEDYGEWLAMVTKNSSQTTVNPDWVVTDTYLAIREGDDKVIGIIDFRHTLNDFLRDFGHIGYSVRPEERRKGYASEMLSKVLERAWEKGFDRVQLSCHVVNMASAKTIEKNGGQKVRTFQYEGQKADIYEITRNGYEQNRDGKEK